MPKIISNTTPLISLLKIDQLEFLREIYETIIIPKAVYLEIEKGRLIANKGNNNQKKQYLKMKSRIPSRQYHFIFCVTSIINQEIKEEDVC